MSIAQVAKSRPDEKTLDQRVAGHVKYGWRVESRTETQAVLVKGHRPNHILHLILSIITVGIWIPVWICVAIISGEKRKTLSA